jgi:hypothetical protein
MPPCAVAHITIAFTRQPARRDGFEENISLLIKAWRCEAFYTAGCRNGCRISVRSFIHTS